VIDHILKHGQITTEDLKNLGYDHPPRAARDVREQGIPLVTTRVLNSEGRRIGAYTFGNPEDLIPGLLGRSPMSKRFKNQMLETYGTRCAIDGHEYADRYLQPDHRVPVEVGGDTTDDKRDPADYQMLCASCNRAKSWSCEACDNIEAKDLAVCRTCYWASPADYSHVAMVPERRATVVWQGHDELKEYQALAKEARQAKRPVSELIKLLLRRPLKRQG